MALIETQKASFPNSINSQALMLDAYNYYDLRQAARLIAQGGVIAASICGVMGFVCDGTQNGAEQIYELKDRDRRKQLITAGSTKTRRKLVDFGKLDPIWKEAYIDNIFDIPTFLVLPAQAGLSPDCTRPDIEDKSINTVAIWWANYYLPTIRLEKLMQESRPDAFIEGSSCNVSDEESIINSYRAFEVFGRGTQRVAAILYDKDFDYGKGLVYGSHTMLRVVRDKIKPLRAGSVHTDSFKPILGNLLDIPVDFQNQEGSVLLNSTNIKTTQGYLRV